MFSFKNLLLNTKCKHVFPCRYKRVFSVGTHAVTTYNPNTLEVTNQWPYETFVASALLGKDKEQSSTSHFVKAVGRSQKR